MWLLRISAWVVGVLVLCPLSLNAQTRFYFPATTATDASITASADWNDASEIERRQMVSVKGASAITTGQTVDILEDQANYQDLDRQYVSRPMKPGVVFVSGVTTVKSVIMMQEVTGTDDVTQCILAVRVIAADGTTVQATLLAVGNYGVTAEFNNGTFRNKRCADGDTLTSNYTTVFGDRLVVEIGYQTDGAETTPQAIANWGENATDCAENETNTTNCAGWIEFSNAITFALVQDVVNTTHTVMFDTSGSVVNNFATNVTAGNTVIALVSVGTTGVTFTVTGNSGGEAFTSSVSRNDVHGSIGCFYVHGSVGGYTGVKVAVNSGTPFGVLSTYEISGLQNTLTTTGTNSNSSVTNHLASSTQISGTGFFGVSAMHSVGGNITNAAGWVENYITSISRLTEHYMGSLTNTQGPWTINSSQSSIGDLCFFPEATAGGVALRGALLGVLP